MATHVEKVQLLIHRTKQQCDYHSTSSNVLHMIFCSQLVVPENPSKEYFKIIAASKKTWQYLPIHLQVSHDSHQRFRKIQEEEAQD